MEDANVADPNHVPDHIYQVVKNAMGVCLCMGVSCFFLMHRVALTSPRIFRHRALFLWLFPSTGSTAQYMHTIQGVVLSYQLNEADTSMGTVWVTYGVFVG